MNIIGRKKEMQLLEQYTVSGRAEFIAVYGRRRVGKTFLIRQYFNNQFAFDITGIIEGQKNVQMAAFHDALKQHGYRGTKPRTWLDAFFALRDMLAEKLADDAATCVVFIDEMPCFDTPKSGFVQALGHFWNSWGAWQSRLKLIVCGSATSWMVRNIIDNRGGLHNRITHEIDLKAFTLSETEEYFKSRNFTWSRLGILHAYMAVGGIPYYLSLFEPGESPAQGIDRLFFSEDGELRKEYHRLYNSLFRNPEPYMKIINLLAQKPMGLTRDEISRRLNTDNNGHLGNMLTDLTYCDFIKYRQIKDKKIKINSGIYQLVDFLTLFHHHFVQKDSRQAGRHWIQMQGTPAANSWLGLAYERTVQTHAWCVKKALGIENVATESYSWRSKDTCHPAQIDLIVERADKMINLCEIKYSESTYILTKDEYLKIGNRVEAFRKATGTRYGIIPTIITTFGLARGTYAESIHAEIVLDDLFS